MKEKKIIKNIGKVLLIILILIVLFLSATTIIFNIKLNNAKEYMKEKGYYNLVSAGDYDVNLYRCGNENGKHNIIALAGYLDCEMFIGWRKMTAPLEENNQIVFVDRAGYGVSDDYDGDMTVEHIVEHYRTALENAGIAKPYVLMPHSIGGLYATYWQSKYPDEIEAVMIIDGTEVQHFDIENEPLDLGIVKVMNLAGKAGLLSPMIKSDYAKELSTLSDEERPVSAVLLEKTMASSGATVEILNMQKNSNFIYDALETNDIPKMYICVFYSFHTKEELIREGFTADHLRNYYGVAGDTDDEVFANYLDTLAQKRDILNSYIDRMGNCQTIELQGQHEIMFDKPEECGKILKDFIDGLDN